MTSKGGRARPEASGRVSSYPPRWTSGEFVRRRGAEEVLEGCDSYANASTGLDSWVPPRR